MAIHTRSSNHATSHGEERSTSRAGPSVAEPCHHCRPVPATVATAPVCGSYVRRAWLTVSATITLPSGSSARPCGSLKAAGLSVKPRSPVPIRRTTLSPSAASSTSWCRVVSETRRLPVGSSTALPGKRRSVATGSGGT